MEPEQIPSSSQNPITGDHMITKASSKAYRDGYDRIFNKNPNLTPCGLCGFKFDQNELGKYGCPDCEGEETAENKWIH
jgi:predicted Zn-ribbon and HTH transcriptional regulator